MTAYIVAPPSLTSGVTNITFNTLIGGATFVFYMTWDGLLWRGYVVLPDASIRDIGVYPNVENWSRYQDYSLIFSYDADSIGYSDLTLSTIYVIDKLN
jgi:hypothetical protein